MTLSATRLSCDVCGNHEALGVAQLPGVQVGVAYCRRCLKANAHPWGIMVANTARLGGLHSAPPWWVNMVTSTCLHLGRSQNEFDLAVEIEMRELEQPVA